MPSKCAESGEYDKWNGVQRRARPISKFSTMHERQEEPPKVGSLIKGLKVSVKLWGDCIAKLL